MQLPAFKSMYDDAMTIEELRSLIRRLSLVEVNPSIAEWDRLSSKIETLVRRLGNVDIETARSLLDAWKHARDEHEDFRVLMGRMEYELMPALVRSIEVLYGPIELNEGKWTIQKTPIGFMTIKDDKTNKYLHSIYDPMNEAALLADRLYSIEMQDFHILGCGLGYLAYQMWEKSDRSLHIHIYEDDNTILEYARQIGVLDWIAPENLIVEEKNNPQTLLKSFFEDADNGLHDHYISDWKVGYYDNEYARTIDRYDYNERTARILGLKNTINQRENAKRPHSSISDFKEKKIIDYKEFIVVSAGPSLNDNIDFLKESSGNKGIIVVNTALKRLASENIEPDIVVALDSFPILASHLSGIEEFTKNVSLIAPITVSRQYVDLYQGPLYYWTEDEENDSDFTWGFGGTVASFGIDVAYYLGAERIYLVGSDLSYPGSVNYAQGVAKAETVDMAVRIDVESVDGGQVSTDYVYDAYRKMIEGQIAMHPDVQVYNMSRHGAKIAGTRGYA